MLTYVCCFLVILVVRQGFIFSFQVLSQICHFVAFSNNSGGIFRLSGAFCVDSAIFRTKILPGGRFWAKAKVPSKLFQSERFLDKFSSCFYVSFYLRFVVFCSFSYDAGGIFRLSGAFCVGSAIFRPKIQPGVDVGANTCFCFVL